MFSTATDPSSAILDIITYLERKFNEENTTTPLETASAFKFVEWAKEHMAGVRPHSVFPVQNNYGITLTNGQQVKLCPDDTKVTTGDMANPDISIPFTKTV